MMAEISATRPISASQVRSIGIRRRQLGIDDDAYYGLLKTHFGVESCKKLTRRQAHECLNMLGVKLENAPGTHVRRRKRAEPEPERPGVTSLPTRAQRELIAELKRELGWSDNHYQRWLQRFQGINRPTTRSQAGRVIEGLKAMSRRQAG